MYHNHETIQRYHEFTVRHGQPFEVGNELIFADGASCDIHATRLMEPPESVDERLFIQLKFAKEAERRLYSDFTRVRNNFQDQASLAKRYANLPAPPPDAAEVLQKLKAEHEHWVNEIQRIETERKNTPRARAERERDEQQSQERSRLDGIQRDLGMIHI